MLSGADRGRPLPEIFFAGYSMGGNLVLKMAGELGAGAPKALRGVCAVCAALDLASCVDATDGFRNILYRRYFVRKLKRRFREKLAIFPDRMRTRSRSRPYHPGFRRHHHGAQLRLPQCGGLLLPGERYARDRGDSRANVTAQCGGRSDGSAADFSRIPRSRETRISASSSASTAATARFSPPMLPSATGRKPGWSNSARSVRNCFRRMDQILVAPIAGLKNSSYPTGFSSDWLKLGVSRCAGPSGITTISSSSRRPKSPAI